MFDTPRISRSAKTNPTAQSLFLSPKPPFSIWVKLVPSSVTQISMPWSLMLLAMAYSLSWKVTKLKDEL